MIFIYEKGTNKFIGMSTSIFDNGTWREATLQELYPHFDPDKYGCVYEKDHIKYALAPNDWQFQLNEQGEPIRVERKPQPPQVHLSTDAPDTDGDGLPEIKADGTSNATIQIELKNAKGVLIKEETTILLRTTGGALSSRRIVTKTGKATVTLTSSLETVTVNITATAEGMVEGAITFEFMPN